MHSKTVYQDVSWEWMGISDFYGTGVPSLFVFFTYICKLSDWHLVVWLVNTLFPSCDVAKIHRFAWSMNLQHIILAYMMNEAPHPGKSNSGSESKPKILACKVQEFPRSPENTVEMAHVLVSGILLNMIMIELQVQKVLRYVVSSIPDLAMK